MSRKSMLQYVLQVVFLVAQFHSNFLMNASASSLLYSNNFDAGLGSDYVKAGACYPYSLTSASPDGGGNYALRVIMKGMEGCEEANGEIKHRAMMRHGVGLRFAPRTPYWIGWRIFVPNDFPTGRDDASLIYGLMSGNTPGETAFFIRGSKFTLLRRWSDATGLNEVKEYEAPVQKGKWTDFVIYTERSWENDGVLKVWMDGKLVVNAIGKNATNYKNDPYMRTGIYWGTRDRSDNYTLYFDNVRVQSGADGYDLVNPAIGLAAPLAPVWASN
ncbi:polysaccharide lyase-like protein [Thiogranum longum]|uniref:Polysaccharide lyase-like protein n=1 Tax=Thiogranum longum TaxID=1537524 RepID=A0A4R1HC30_9GAMM|nr:heparin lyase I family protein [Thiogranum longum]TCK18161.1 polysaccharide lyase-like protein [Thiogranum longum]